MRYVHDTALQLRDRPCEDTVERSRRTKVKIGELVLERGEVERRHDPTGCDALMRQGQLPGEGVVQTLAVLARRKEGGAGLTSHFISQGQNVR